MFNWLGNLFPYSDLHSLNLDWILSKMKETAAQAAQAIADSANALAQVIEAKIAAQDAQTAAQDAQTAAQNAQTAANNAQTAANNAADSAENAVNVAQQAKSAAQTAQNTAETAQSAAQTAQNTANTAQSAAQTAQNTANTAQSAAQTAQSTAETAQTAADNALSKFPVKGKDIADGAVTNKKMSAANFFVGIGSYSVEKTASSTDIAAGQAVFSFTRTAALAVIFVVYNTSNYNVGNTTHTLLMYSDPFFLNTISTKRVIDITLEDFNKQTGENTEYKGSLIISVSASRAVTGKITFTEKLPFSDDISIPYGISGLAARPLP